MDLHQLLESLVRAPKTEFDKCWVCHGKSGEAPPVCGPTDSNRLMLVCECGAKAHKKCIVDWALDSGTRNGSDRRLSNVLTRQETLYMEASIASYGTAVVGLRAKDPRKQIYTSGADVDCVYCGRAIVFLAQPSTLMSLYSFVHEKLLVCREFIPVPTMAGLAYLCFHGLKRAGAFMWSSMADESTVAKMLDISPGTLTALLPPSLYHLLPQIHLATLPMVFLSMRWDAKLPSIASYTHTAISILTRPASPITYALPLLKLVDFVYDGIKRMTFGQYYYRSGVMVPPAMLPYTYTEEDLHFLAHEAQRVEQLEEEIARQVTQAPNLFDKIFTWLFPFYTDETILGLNHEDGILAMNEYQARFHDEDKYYYWNFFWKLGTTLLWPVCGAFLGGLLGEYTPINSWLRFVGGEREVTYIRNILSMAAIAVVRDFLRLFQAWRAFRHYDLGIEVIGQDPQFLEVECIFHDTEKPPALGEIDMSNLELSSLYEMPAYETRVGRQSLGAYLFGDITWSVMPQWGEFEQKVLTYTEKWVYRQV